MFTEEFFNALLKLEDNCFVSSVETDIDKGEILINIAC